MKIIALEFYKNGEMKEDFALGGSMEKEKLDMNKTYPASLQNYLIDTGKEVILVDTGLPVETPEFKREPNQKLYMGEKVADFATAVQNAGYKIEDIDKVVVTHKHPDHSGELRLFKNAKIYISQIEADAMNLQGENIIRVNFQNGKYKNFSQSEKITEGITMLPAYGHTEGNSIVVVEVEGLFYMIHGDVTYTDEALRRNELSVVFENKDLAKETLEKVRKFIKENDTVYLSTHTPEGIKSLKEKLVMKLANTELSKSKVLGGITVKNPIVMAPMTTFSGNLDGTVSQEELNYYKARSKNTGIVITATTYVSESGKGFPGQFAAYSDEFIPSLKSLADTIKSEGAIAILQMVHAGRMALSNEIPNGDTISASAIPAERPDAITPREMTEKEIEDTIKDFGKTAKRAIDAGFDGVEIHGANTYLIQQFFSPHSNRRQDTWGGSIDKRMNFSLAVINEVKKVVKEQGKDNFIIGYRFSPEEIENPGITLQDTIKLVDVLANQGLSYLHASLNNFWQTSIRDLEDKDPIVLKILKTINGRVPFIGVGSISTPEDAIKALKSGADFIALGREIIMEPEWMTKVYNEKYSEIRTTLSKKDEKILDIPTPLWNVIVNTAGWFPLVD
ncbi:hypothetical protein psyc5s11_24870 [Clostridium gelidum]|uniref:Metallo-beta-lactamase domain-containing protein n=1 Tax=Clostridium gelidum TaxID=704125 RepID=A0ABM7T691_9CLOT|nr:MBL fold metallo-hydrolase [Clostridium gelidum]BCZ46420.1 hypothetical protein psyc5s11_24870 [Clostridium gelidum]